MSTVSISVPTVPVTSEEKVSRSSCLYRIEQVYFLLLVRPLCGAQRRSPLSLLCHSLTRRQSSCAWAWGRPCPLCLWMEGRRWMAALRTPCPSHCLTRNSLCLHGEHDAHYTEPARTAASGLRATRSCRAQGRGLCREPGGQPAAPYGC